MLVQITQCVSSIAKVTNVHLFYWKIGKIAIESKLLNFCVMSRKCMQKATSYLECSFSNRIIFLLLQCYKNHITFQWMNWTK